MIGNSIEWSLLCKAKIKNYVIGIISTVVIVWGTSHIYTLLGLQPFASLPSEYSAYPDTSLFVSFNVRDALSVSLALPIFTLLFTDMLDSISTFVGVAQVGGFIDNKTGLPHNVGKALFVDGFSTFISGIFGTSTTTYIESAAGVEEGGKTGLTAVVARLLFLPFMWLIPLLSFIPQVSTAPVLLLIGLFMMQPLSHINFKRFLPKSSCICYLPYDSVDLQHHTGNCVGLLKLYINLSCNWQIEGTIGHAHCY